MLSRRGFLGLFGAAAANEVGRKFFFSPVGGWKSEVLINPADAGLPAAFVWQQFLNTDMITAEALRILRANLHFSEYRGYDDSFQSIDAKIGSTLNIRTPIRFAARV